MKAYKVEALKQIATLGGLKEPVSLSSKIFGEMLGVSQQTASKRLMDLTNEGLISRSYAARREHVKLTPKGIDILRREFADYKRIFEEAKELSISGAIVSGLGEGAFYMRQKGYKEQFKRKLAFEPFEGTLNLRISGGELAKLEIMRDAEGIAIEAFESGGRTFGGAKCFRAKAGGLECAVVLPLRTHYSDTIELISRHNLRGRLGLNDGDRVEISVML